MVTRRLVFILVIIQSSLVLPMTLLQDSSDKHVKEKHDFTHRLYKRQVSCNEGEYQGDKHCCKNCRKGTYAESDCAAPQGEPVCKYCTKGVDFMDEPNGYPRCEKCRDCDSGSGQEELHPCTTTQNTVCKCKKGFFCSESLSSADVNCNRCQHCSECANGIDEECTSTKDTICKNFSGRAHAIVWPILGVIVFAGITFVLLRYCRNSTREEQIVKSPPEKHKDSEPFIPPTPTCPPELENIDLDNHLFAIAGLMAQESVQKLVSKKLSPVDQEEIKINNSKNAREEKYELLKKWYSANGHRGAFKMLIENSTEGEAEKIIDLVQKGNAEP
ncbi:unnamed protein product [Staurois parvus]|uniref:Tumor necrosis factor receptor superfamily member 6 n=1 Tax=Staurois parvus TaxID=386267 RepID=A0ABN9GE41_9NEOB|nr:unnamed protein product [Staurois parvus]